MTEFHSRGRQFESGRPQKKKQKRIENDLSNTRTASAQESASCDSDGNTKKEPQGARAAQDKDNACTRQDDDKTSRAKTRRKHQRNDTECKSCAEQRCSSARAPQQRELVRKRESKLPWNTIQTPKRSQLITQQPISDMNVELIMNASLFNQPGSPRDPSGHGGSDPLRVAHKAIQHGMSAPIASNHSATMLRTIPASAHALTARAAPPFIEHKQKVDAKNWSSSSQVQTVHSAPFGPLRMPHGCGPVARRFDRLSHKKATSSQRARDNHKCAT